MSCKVPKAHVLDVADAKKLIERFGVENTIFWVGAGADRDKPTNLPLSRELLEGLLRLLIGDEHEKKFTEMWNECTSVAGESSAPPRMESVLEALKVCENDLKIDGSANYSFSEGLRFFNEAPSNVNTQSLGWLVSRGSTVITTNYSDVIEREANAHAGSTVCLPARPDSDSPTLCYSESPDGEKKVVHIHGVSEIPETMGVTLRTISRDFPEDMQQWLAKLMNDSGKLFVFYGYSGSDDYDVNPFFKKIAESERTQTASALYLCHSNDATVGASRLLCKEGVDEPSRSLKDGGGIVDLDEKKTRLLNPFSDVILCVCKGLPELVGYADATRDDLACQEGKPFEWLSSFKSNSGYDELDCKQQQGVADLLLLALIDYFGFCLTENETYDEARVQRMSALLTENGRWYLLFYGKRLAECFGDPNLHQLIDPQAAPINREMLLKEGTHVDGEAELMTPYQLREFIRDYRGEDEIGWYDLTTHENHWMQSFFRNVLELENLAEIVKYVSDIKKELFCLRESSGRALHEAFGRFRDLRQIAVERRVNSRANALLAVIECDAAERGRLFTEALEQSGAAMTLYRDISSMLGVSNVCCENAAIKVLHNVVARVAKYDFCDDLEMAYKIATAMQHARASYYYEAVESFVSRMSRAPYALDQS